MLPEGVTRGVQRLQAIYEPFETRSHFFGEISLRFRLGENFIDRIVDKVFWIRGEILARQGGRGYLKKRELVRVRKGGTKGKCQRKARIK